MRVAVTLLLVTAAAMVVVLALVGRPPGHESAAGSLDRESAQLVSEVAQVLETAGESGWPWGLALYTQEGRVGYQWMRRDGRGWHAASVDGGAGSHLWPRELAVLVIVAGEPVPLGELPPEPHIRFSGGGEVTPFAVSLQDARHEATLEVDERGELVHQRVRR